MLKRKHNSKITDFFSKKQKQVGEKPSVDVASFVADAPPSAEQASTSNALPAQSSPANAALVANAPPSAEQASTSNALPAQSSPANAALVANAPPPAEQASTSKGLPTQSSPANASSAKDMLPKEICDGRFEVKYEKRATKEVALKILNENN